MATKYNRLFKLDERVMDDGIKLTEQQIKSLEKANPEFAEPHVESKYPGYLLLQGTFYVDQFKGIGRLYL